MRKMGKMSEEMKAILALADRMGVTLRIADSQGGEDKDVEESDFSRDAPLEYDWHTVDKAP